QHSEQGQCRQTMTQHHSRIVDCLREDAALLGSLRILACLVSDVHGHRRKPLFLAHPSLLERGRIHEDTTEEAHDQSVRREKEW
ncbi:hypothetical protein PENTCL1PPCAC_16157, partial [Pristionchus entomophagus]